MHYRVVDSSNYSKTKFNRLVSHPVQSWQWGEFRQYLGQTVIRLVGQNQEKKDVTAMSLTLHPLPVLGKLSWQVASAARSLVPDEDLVSDLPQLLPEKVVAVKFEPDWYLPVAEYQTDKLPGFIHLPQVRPSDEFYYRYSRLIDLSLPGEQLLSQMKSKTRYNLRLAHKHGVEVMIDNSDQAFEAYLSLMSETTHRQKFQAHDRHYHQQMWQALHPDGIAQLLVARYHKQILAAWILFVWQDRLFYVYGASTRRHRELMASYALMWGAIQYGQQQKLNWFDVWGTLGPQPDPRHPWYGFHRFKAGFGGIPIKFLGSYDLVLQKQMYPLWQTVLAGRKQFLFLKRKASQIMLT